MTYNGGMSRPGARANSDRRTVEERSCRLEEVFRAYAPRILDYARHRGATLVEAEDVVSEVFVVVTRRLEDAPDEILPWLYGVARKVMRNQLRSKRRKAALSLRIEREEAQIFPGAVEATSDTAGEFLLGEALAMLSERDREVILLVAWDELSYEEAARSLGCTPAAYAQMLRRARQRVSQIMDDLRTSESPGLAMGE